MTNNTNNNKRKCICNNFFRYFLITKETKEVENKVNKSLSMIVFVSLPLSLGLCILQKSVWTIFYDVNPYVLNNQ